jgi:hypothetical protein
MGESASAKRGDVMVKRRVPVPPGVQRGVEQALDAALDKALAIQRPVVLGYLDRVRARRPDAPPAQVIRQLERHYLAAVVGTGAASGGAAALPGIGTGTSVATGAAEVAAFVSATAMFVLAVAEVHGVPVDDPRLRRALVLTVLLGDAGQAAVGTAAGQGALTGHWGHVIARPGSRDLLGRLDTGVAHVFVRRFGARQGALLVGRALPFGLGAGIGAAGNAALGRSAIAAARRAFGPAPRQFTLRLTATPRRPPFRRW